MAASDFHIERSPNGTGDWVEIDTVAVSLRTYLDEDLSCGTPYYYRIRAHDHEAGTYSAYSNVADATTLACRYAQKPSAILEIEWDGVANPDVWTDETARAIMPVSYSYGIMSGPGDLATFGLNMPVAQMTLRLDNYDGRYSVDCADSQAATNGLFQRKIRFSPGYLVDGTPDLGVIFIGRVQDIQEDEATAQVAITCYGLEHDLIQARAETVALEGLRADELIDTLATAAGFTDTALDRGYTIVPWYYGDADDCLAEMREIAEAEGGFVWVDPQTGQLEFRAWDRWVGYTVVATFDRAGTENAKPIRGFRDARDMVNVTYTPRRKGRLTTVHQLTRPIVIAPASATQQRFRFRYPLAAVDGYASRARTSGGQNMDASLEVGTTAPASATTWLTTLSNSSTTQAIVVDKFSVTGYPLEGLPNREYRATAATPLHVSRRHDVYPGQEIDLQVRGRYTLQTEAQAKLIAHMRLFRLHRLDPVTSHPKGALFVQLGAVPGDNTLNVCDVVSVDLSDGISTIEGDFALVHRRGSYGERWEDTWLGVQVSDMYEYVVASAAAADGYYVVGTSLLGVGRLGY